MLLWMCACVCDMGTRLGRRVHHTAGGVSYISSPCCFWDISPGSLSSLLLSLFLFVMGFGLQMLRIALVVCV